VRVSINAPGWGSVNPSQFAHHPSKLIEKDREVELVSDLDPNYLLVGPPIFLLWRFEATLAIWRGLYQKNTLPAVGLKPVITNPDFLLTKLFRPSRRLLII